MVLTTLGMSCIMLPKSADILAPVSSSYIYDMPLPCVSHNRFHVYVVVILTNIIY